jgi:uncharacterized protein
MQYAFRNNRRYNAYADYIKERFGGRIQKVSVDAGFTCPNRDGTVGTGGCTFCNNESFNPSYCSGEKPIAGQLAQGINFLKKRYPRNTGYMAYFQAYTNTFDTVEVLDAKFRQALTHPGIIGLVIGTRPDCIDDEKLDYIQSLGKEAYVVVEYGIESCYEKTLLRVNRGHSMQQTIEALEKTAARGIHTGGHLIFGLPGETKEEMLNEAEILSELPLDSIKFHQLQIIKGTKMESEYLEKPGDFSLFEMEEYLLFMAAFLERLNPRIMVERFASESPPGMNLGMSWGVRYDEFLKRFEKKLAELDTWQGKLYRK